MRSLLLLLLVAACHSPVTAGADPDAGSVPGTDAGSDTSCAPGLAGAPCVIALYDVAIAGCDPLAVTALRTELDARAGLGPLWANGRALIRTRAPASVAGDWNSWSTTALTTTAVCSSDLVVGIGAVPTGLHPYKLFASSAWSLDPANPAFAYDDFAGNSDGRNSVINTPDSGLGHLIELPDACSTELGNCRAVTAYLPPAYDAPENGKRTYPVMFMHDGQNLWDDHDCCFGHTGWELNITLDQEIAAGKVAPLIVIGAASSSNRNNEYGLDPVAAAKLINFQITEIQPKALALVRHDDGKLAIAGSSLGGLTSMDLALAHPEIYNAAASLSGAFWPREDLHTALRDEVPMFGKQALALYLDSGGNPSDNSDGAQDTIDVRELLVAQGWQHADSPSCTPGPNALCYAWAQGATHDELAWKARAWRFLEFLFPAQH